MKPTPVSNDPAVGDEDWITHSLIMIKWKELRAEIDRHKWIESERAGYDIGWEHAYWDYMRKKSRTNAHD